MKTALVTGAARRIGASIAKHLAEHGYNIAIQYASSEDEAQTLAQELRQHGGQAIAIEADLLDADACSALFRNVTEQIGPISLLINNASIFHNDDILEIDWDLWEKHFSIHLKAPTILSAEMAKQPEGSVPEGLIVNIIDQRVWRLNPNFLSYTL